MANNAVSNLYLGAGVAPISEMLTAGMTVGIGTDDGNCNNSANMLADMKVVALAQKGKYQQGTAITAEKVLGMATIDGARAVGLDDVIGSLEVGKRADVITVDLSGPHMTPTHSIPSALVYQTLGHEVDTVVVDGNDPDAGRHAHGTLRLRGSPVAGACPTGFRGRSRPRATHHRAVPALRIASAWPG